MLGLRFLRETISQLTRGNKNGRTALVAARILLCFWLWASIPIAAFAPPLVIPEAVLLHVVLHMLKRIAC